MRQAHMGFLNFSSTLAVVAMRAGCYDIRPFVAAAHVSRNDMVDGHPAVPFPAILTGIIVTPKYFPAR